MTTLDKVRTAISDSGCTAHIDADTPLDELNIDSLEFIDLVLRVNEACQANIPDEVVPTLVTVGDICSAVENHAVSV